MNILIDGYKTYKFNLFINIVYETTCKIFMYISFSAHHNNDADGW